VEEGEQVKSESDGVEEGEQVKGKSGGVEEGDSIIGMELLVGIGPVSSECSATENAS
jgi:hypothetical protein